MKYYVAPTSEFRITHNNASSVGEITIKLGLNGPSITCVDSSHISGVYDSSSGKKNPQMPYCEIDEKTPKFTDSWVSTSASRKNQITLKLKTKLKQL